MVIFCEILLRFSSSPSTFSSSSATLKSLWQTWKVRWAMQRFSTDEMTAFAVELWREREISFQVEQRGNGSKNAQILLAYSSEKNNKLHETMKNLMQNFFSLCFCLSPALSRRSVAAALLSASMSAYVVLAKFVTHVRRRDERDVRRCWSVRSSSEEEWEIGRKRRKIYRWNITNCWHHSFSSIQAWFRPTSSSQGFSAFTNGSG